MRNVPLACRNTVEAKSDGSISSEPVDGDDICEMGLNQVTALKDKALTFDMALKTKRTLVIVQGIGFWNLFGTMLSRLNSRPTGFRLN